MDLSLPRLAVGFFGLASRHLLIYLPLLLPLAIPHLLLTDTQPWLGIWMPSSSNGAGSVELECRVGDLRVTIQGPSDQATSLLQQVLGLDPPQPRSSSPPASELSFDLVSHQSQSAALCPPARRAETRADIEATFNSCPAHFLDSAKKLSGSSVSGEERIKRAWKAGQWAKAVADGRSLSPNRTPQLDLRPRFYAVLRATGVSLPTICRSAGTYWGIIGDLTSSSSITHGFPSELEAKIYFAGAGIVDYESKA